MQTLTFDNIPQFLLALDKKVDAILERLQTVGTAQTKENDHVLMDMKEASEFLRKCPATLYGMTSEKSIPFHKRGNKVYFFKDELVKWIENGHVMPSSITTAETASFESHLGSMQKGKRRKPSALVG